MTAEQLEETFERLRLGESTPEDDSGLEAHIAALTAELEQANIAFRECRSRERIKDFQLAYARKALNELMFDMDGVCDEASQRAASIACRLTIDIAKESADPEAAA